MSETHVADFRLPSETQAAGLRLRAGKFEDGDTCGSICYGAFKAIADQHNTLMSVSLYNEPAGAFMPSVLY